MKHIFYRRKNDSLEVDIYDIDDWEGFEKIVAFVENNYHGKVMHRNDGPGARRWILDCDNKKFELIHDDGYGNYFIANSKESEEIVTTIVQDIENRIKNDP
jgi:hypothetical protein